MYVKTQMCVEARNLVLQGSRFTPLNNEKQTPLAVFARQPLHLSLCQESKSRSIQESSSFLGISHQTVGEWAQGHCQKMKKN